MRRGYIVMFTTLSACSLFVDLSGLSSGTTTSSEGGVPVDADSPVSDAPIESVDGGPINLTPHELAIVGDVPAETGNAQQQHLVYAQNSQNWWIFYINDSDTTSMEAAVSTDFATWLPAPPRPLSEAMATEGRNFAMAYTNVAGKDIVHDFNSHFVADEDGKDARSTITGTSITYESGILVSALAPYNASVNPDGPNMAITSDGYVHVATGWKSDAGSGIGRMNLFLSSIPDLGSSAMFVASYAANGSIASIGGGPIANRLLLPTQNGLLYLWPTSQSTMGITYGIAWSISTGTATPTPDQDIFSGATETSESTNDWNACDVGGTVHLVRRTTDSGKNDSFDEMVFDGSTWTSGAPMPKDPGKADSGIVLASDGTSLVAFAIASDAANSIRASKLSGGSWSAWTTVVGTSAARNYLSASACGTSKHAAIIWTEGSATPYRIEGVDVSSLL